MGLSGTATQQVAYLSNYPRCPTVRLTSLQKAQSFFQNVPCGIAVSVMVGAALRACPFPQCQAFHFPVAMVAMGTKLVGGSRGGDQNAENHVTPPSHDS